MSNHVTAAIFAAATLLLCCAQSGPATARVLHVGGSAILQTPGQAALVALDGDRIEIEPDLYHGCAVWHASHLTIVADGPGVVIDGSDCFAQGIFLIFGNAITVRGITFARARAPDHTGAGIRAEGAGLTVENSRFIDNENGILAIGPPGSVVHVTDSEFRGNGSCKGACAHAIYAGTPIRLLRIDRCRFRDTHIAHNVKSRARNTIVLDSRIEDARSGTSSYLIDIPNGGNLLVQHNVLAKGARSDNALTAISIGEEGVSNPTATLIIRDNDFTSALPAPTAFVRNGTATQAMLIDNQLHGVVRPLDGPGRVLP